MIAVFKTNVQDPRAAQKILTKLLEIYPLCLINFDLEDADRILRLEGQEINQEQVMLTIHLQGYQCEELV